MPLCASSKRPVFGRHGSCECSPFVPEQLTFEEPKWDRRALQFDESPIPSAAKIVDCARDQLLTCSRLAQDQQLEPVVLRQNQIRLPFNAGLSPTIAPNSARTSSSR